MLRERVNAYGILVVAARHAYVTCNMFFLHYRGMCFKYIRTNAKEFAFGDVNMSEVFSLCIINKRYTNIVSTNGLGSVYTSEMFTLGWFTVAYKDHFAMYARRFLGGVGTCHEL